MAGAKIRIWLRSLVGVALILGVPAILVYALRTAYQSSPEPGTISRSVFDYAKPTEAPKPAAPAEPQSASTTAPAPGTTRMYECRQNGEAIYSSQPCGSDAVARDISTQSINTSKRPVLDACADARQEIEQINARMRQPYTSAEGEYYRERLRKLSARLSELKCGRP
jgi:hypothetical protein